MVARTALGVVCGAHDELHAAKAASAGREWNLALRDALIEAGDEIVIRPLEIAPDGPYY